ncbi:hypothetical protein CRENBAI_005332 [Crenichthys baileyi]|uniref:Tetratricopeptide repeat protein 28 n=1 Tax=Crenichthys baileyi TaxID=28760 RepID=A0AAV9R1J1_9TELE
MEKQATLKEKFSVLGYRTASRPIRSVAGDERSRCGLSKVEFMEKVRQSNEACQRGDFQEAVWLYSDALQADPQNCILYSNRSGAFLKLGQHQAALEDAEKACGLNPKWPKGYGSPKALVGFLPFEKV